MTEKFYSFTKTAALRLALVLAFVSLAAGSASAQSRTVTGTVKDSMGPVLAASVVVEGTTLGVSTDLNGKFRIEVPASAKQLRVSFIGYDDSYVTLQPSQTDYEVTLSESSNQLDDVVVVGYATVKRRDVVGSVSSINSEALTQMPVASVSEAMSGRMAGVQVTATEGDPDADVRIRVRGTGSITQDSSPLYIVDGFPVESISDIPASDIQSIDVLKDAFSTAIYGSRGANGVIIVTTKSGESGRITVNYNIYGPDLDYAALYSKAGVPLPQLLLGPHYAPLRRQFQNLPPRAVRQKVQDILVSTGGADAQHIALQLAQYLSGQGSLEDVQYHFVAGAMNADLPALQAIARQCAAIRVHQNVQNMARLMRQCDLAIAAAGSTLYELCACGVPTVTYAFADNQLLGMRAFEKQGVMVGAGDVRSLHIPLEVITSRVEEVSLNYKNRKRLASKMQRLVDGSGAGRIVNYIR